MKSRNQSMDMTQGVIWKQLAYFALPLFLGNLCQQLYNTADSVIVGKFVGKDALAAVSSSGNLIFMMTGFFMGLFVGAGVIISRYFGAKCYDRLEAAVHTDLAFAMVCGVLLTLVGIFLTPQILVCQEYTMPVAETASTFNEVLTVSAAIDAAESNDEKLALIESQLSDACQIICDIYSRYLFESAVFAARPEEFLDPDRLCQMMLEAQKKAYGDGLDQTCLHPYMWLCKGHYYSGGLSFYNFPYAFGGLFARGLYAKYQQEGKDFVPLYKKMLHATSVTCVEDTAKIAGIDLTDKAFWRQGLQSLADEIDLFCQLVK